MKIKLTSDQEEHIVRKAMRQIINSTYEDDKSLMPDFMEIRECATCIHNYFSIPSEQI